MTDQHRRLPAEWEPQSAVMLTWPHHRGDWRPWLPRVEPVFTAIARAVTAREHLLVSCLDEAHREHVAGLLAKGEVDAGRVHLHVVPSNDTWARDHGPITVFDTGAARLLDFRFNGWGGKYAADLDDRLTAALHQGGTFGDTPLEAIGMVLEGGGIESDGAGTLLTTTSCLLSGTRNPELDRAGVEAALKRHFGLERVLWLEHGHLEGDDTDGHIDTLARFCDARTIAYCACDDMNDPHHAPLKAMEAELNALRDADGNPYRLVPLPLPRPHHSDDGDRLPATYANFLIINGAVLVPTYGDERNDPVALERLAGCFPDREIIGIDCSPLVLQYGSLHCVTMQIPAGVPIG